MHTSFQDELDATREAMREPVLSAEEQMERRIDSVVRDLDEIIAFAANIETVDLVLGQRVAVGQLVARVQLLGSFVNAKPPGLRMVRNSSRRT